MSIPPEERQARTILSALIPIEILLAVISFGLLAITWYKPKEVVYQVDSSTFPAKQVWQFEADESIGDAYFSPTSIFLTSHNSIYAINRFSGQKLWRIERNSIQFLILPEAANTHTLIAVTDSGTFIEALNTETGKTRWRASVKSAANSGYAQATVVTVDAEQVFVGAFLSRGTRVFALDLNDGTEIWDAPRELPENSPQAIHLYGNWLAVQGIDLWYLDRDSGSIGFSNTLPETNDITLDGNHIFAIIDGYGIKALDPLTTAEQWNFVATCEYADYWIDSLPQPSLNILSVTASCRKGVLFWDSTRYLVNADSGKIILSYPESSEDFIATAAHLGSYSYYQQVNGSVQAFRSSDGQNAGELLVIPPIEPSKQEPATLFSDNELLLLLLGNNQVFAFESYNLDFSLDTL